MPATAVGNAKGISIRPLIIIFPGNSYRTSTHAIKTPKTTLIIAAIHDVPILVANAYNTLGAVISRHHSSIGIVVANHTIDDRGINTNNEIMESVIPNVIPNPGISVFSLGAINFIKYTSILKKSIIYRTPTTKITNCNQFYLRIKAMSILFHHFFIRRSKSIIC